MKNKRIIIVSLILVAIVLNVIYFHYIKNINNNLYNITKNNIENIDWSSYSSEEINLTKSIEITKEGIYKLTGTIANGYIYINTSGNVKLILNNVSINNSNGPGIYIENAGNVEINTIKNTINTITDGITYKDFEDDINSCLFSHSNLILSGEGTLKIIANNEDGIVTSDNLKIISGNYIISSKNDALKGKGSVVINNGNFTINTSGDGIVSTNDTEENKGYIIIENGNFDIKTNDNKDSAKGIKAANSILINNGNFSIDSTDDSIHTNGDMIINNGIFELKSSDDTIHADGIIQINNGDYDITGAEGIEATYVKINKGNINISATDDGINAGKKSKKYKPTIEINGGNINIKIGPGDTDGIDSNGNLYITGGTINITANSPFDYDGEAKYTGGTIIVNGEITNTITNQTFGGGMPPDGIPNRRR